MAANRLWIYLRACLLHAGKRSSSKTLFITGCCGFSSEQALRLSRFQWQSTESIRRRWRALIARHRPRAVVLTPSFQNPTGASIPAAKRRRIVELVKQFGTILIENDIYSELRYDGEPAARVEAAG